MDALPLELLQHVAEDVGDDPSLFNLRLVSKTLNCVVTPLAFRVVVVRDNVKSAEAVSCLQGCDESITSVVHEVVFRGDPKTDHEEENGTYEISREAGRAVFSGLAKFPNLRNLRLHFH
ncbi:hypothetical protein B0H19DRAFT_1244234, partial [Mycena capillaripes]